MGIKKTLLISNLSSLFTSGISTSHAQTNSLHDLKQEDVPVYKITNPYKSGIPYGGPRKASHNNSKHRMPEKKMKAKKRIEKRSRKLNRR